MADDTTTENQVEQIARKMEGRVGKDSAPYDRDPTIESKLRRIVEVWDDWEASAGVGVLNFGDLANVTEFTLPVASHPSAMLRLTVDSDWHETIFAIGVLSDVDNVSPLDKHILYYDTGVEKYVNGSVDNIAIELNNDLIDVVTTPSALVDGNILKWSGAFNHWRPTRNWIQDAQNVTAVPMNDAILIGNGPASTGTFQLVDFTLGVVPDVTLTGIAVDDVLQWDGAEWVNVPPSSLKAMSHSTLSDLDVQADHTWALTVDGSRKLTGDWDAGDFEIAYRNAVIALTTTAASEDSVNILGNYTETGSFASRSYRGLFLDYNYTYNNAAGLDNSVVQGVAIDMDVSSNALATITNFPQLVKAHITGDSGVTFGSVSPNTPINVLVESSKTTQAFTDGAIFFGLDAGTTSGIVLGTRSFASNAGSGNLTAYQGYAKGETGHSGEAIGVDAFIVTQSTMSRIKAFSAQPKGLAGGGIPGNDKTMAYFGSRGQWLASEASLFVTSTGRADPSAFASSHLTHTSLEGAIYTEGMIECDGTLYADGDVEVVGDMKFTTAAGGLPYACVYAYNNATTMSVSSAGYTQVTIFDTNGPSNQITPDHTNDHITADIAGDYLCTVSMAVSNGAGTGHVLDIDVQKNNGATSFNQLHAHRTLGAGTDVGSVSISGIVTLAASDTIEVWISTSRAVASTITVEDITMSLVQVGGP
jgi:hypothetical protein